jgi:hypothetical protein
MQWTLMSSKPCMDIGPVPSLYQQSSECSVGVRDETKHCLKSKRASTKLLFHMHCLILLKHIINWNTHAKIIKHVHIVTQTHLETTRVSDSVAKTVVQR